MAYQGFGRGLNIDVINNLETIATQGLKPDITIFLSISVNTSSQRRQEKIKDRIESEGDLFLEKVASGFSIIASERNWIKIQAEQSSQMVSQQIQKKLRLILE